MSQRPHPADIHAGEIAEVIADGMARSFDAVIVAVAALELRPTAVEVHRQLGATSVAVYFPHADTASVDQLADRFRLPALLEAGLMYCRRGRTDDPASSATFDLTVRSTRPGVELPDPLEPAPTDRAADPVVITGEVAVPRAQLVLAAPAQLDPIPAR